MSGLAIGESSAFEELYENEYHKIRDYVTNNSGSKVDSQDIFQDGVVVLLEKVKTPGFEFTCKVGTYLYSCCRNLWLKKLRKSNRKISNEYYEIYDIVDMSLLEEPDNQTEKLAEIKERGQTRRLGPRKRGNQGRNKRANVKEVNRLWKPAPTASANCQRQLPARNDSKRQQQANESGRRKAKPGKKEPSEHQRRHSNTSTTNNEREIGNMTIHAVTNTQKE